MPIHFTNLEPNHVIHKEKISTGEELIIVTCPGINDETKGLETSWSADEPPENVNCLFCEWLRGEHPGSPEHGDGDANG